MAFLHEAVIFMGAALIAVPVSKRLGFGSVLGYLAAGVVIGPWAFGLTGNVGSILHFAEFGVVLLLFIIGLELQPSRLWALRKPIFGYGALQMGGTGAVLIAAGLLFGLPPAAAIIAGLGLALSSTAFALQILAEKKQLSTRYGRAAFSVLLFQDLAVIPMLAVIPLMGVSGEMQSASAVWPAILEAVLVIVAVIAVGRLLLRPFLRVVAGTQSQEIFTAAALFVAAGTAALMELVGLSMALGAFLAGVLLADSEYRHELEANIEPFKGLLLGLFFIAVGMSVDLGLVVERPGTVVGLALGLMAVKMTVLYAIGHSIRLVKAGARSLAVTLSQGGEFAFVLFGFAVGAGVLDRETSNLLIVVVTVSMALTPVAVLASDAVTRRRNPSGADPYDRIDDEGHPVVIAGFGRFGQVVARVLQTRGIHFTALDSSFEQIDFVRKFGNKVYFGDAARLDLLRAAGAANAKVFVLAVDDVEASVRIAEMVHRHFPDLKIYARARNRVHAFKLMELGVAHVERETVAASLDLTVGVFEELGTERETARRVVDWFREHDEDLLRQQYEIHHDEQAFIESARQAAIRLEGLFEQDEADAEAEAEKIKD